MKHGEHLRRVRKAQREDAWETYREDYQHKRQQLDALPHPKGRAGTAWDYVRWCIDNGHSRTAFTYLNSL